MQNPKIMGENLVEEQSQEEIVQETFYVYTFDFCTLCFQKK